MKLIKIMSRLIHTSSRPGFILLPAVAFGILGTLLIFRSFAATPNALPGDINGDNTVSILDMSLLLSNYNKTKTQASNPNTDINNDNIVNVFDLSILLSNYGKSGATLPAPTNLVATPNSNGQITLNWDDSSISNFSKYNVYLKLSDGTWKNIVQPVISAVTLTGGVVGQTYTYRVTVVNTSGVESPPSAEVSTKIPSSTSSIYWGGHVEGVDTYNYYYPGQRPGGWCEPGVHEWCNTPWDLETWNKFESNTGKKVSLLGYGQPPPWAQTTWYGGVADSIYNRGAIPFLTMGQDGKDDLAAIAAGTYDTQIRTWATGMKNWNKPIFLRLWWEMNGGWYSWGSNFPATTYVAAWRHVHDVVVAQGATNVTWVWCPNINFIAAANARYPGDGYVDWTCLDGYNKGSSTDSFANLFGPSYQNLLTIAPTKPIIIGEIGSLEYASGVKASWMNDVFVTQLPTNYPKIKGFLWFNWRINECDNFCGNQPFPIESSASSLSGFHNGIQTSHYAAGGSFTLPTGQTKIQPLP
jgi:hypothetical protein